MIISSKQYQLTAKLITGLLCVILMLFISELSFAKKKSKESIYHQYDDKNQPKIINNESKNNLELKSETNVQVITVEKNVNLADVDTSKLNYIPWKILFTLGTSQISLKDLQSNSSARLFSDVNYSLVTQYFIPINKTNQLSLALNNHIEKYKNFSSKIQLTNVSFFRNEVLLTAHKVIQNELILHYGFALRQSLVAYALNSKLIELQNVPRSSIEFEIEDRMFEYDQIHLYASIGLELQLSARTQDYTIPLGNSYYIGAHIKNKKIKNPSMIGFVFKQQNINTSFSTQSRTDMNFSVGAEF